MLAYEGNEDWSLFLRPSVNPLFEQKQEFDRFMWEMCLNQAQRQRDSDRFRHTDEPILSNSDTDRKQHTDSVRDRWI